MDRRSPVCSLHSMQWVLWELKQHKQHVLLMTPSKQAKKLIYYGEDYQKALQEPDQPELKFNRS